MDNHLLPRHQEETDFEYRVRLCVAKLNKEIDADWIEIVQALGLNYAGDHLRKLAYGYKEMVDNGYVMSKGPSDDDIEKDIEAAQAKYGTTIEIQKDGSVKSDKLVRLNEEESKDAEAILKAHGYDPTKWDIITSKSSMWNQHNKKDGTVTLFSSKVTVKQRKEDDLAVEDITEIFKEIHKNHKRRPHTPIKYNKNGKLLELNIADLHVGKLCWVGDANDTYDVTIAKDRFFTIIDDVLTRTKDYSFEKILFVWSNDFFHFDSPEKATTNGTRQDTDLQFHQMYKLGNEMLIEAIDMLTTIAPVHTMYIGSNHDKNTSYFATENLKSWFRNDPNVTVDATPVIRKYYEFGQCLIGFSHGHAEGKRLGKVMPIEAKEAWGRTKFHEMHAGHFHSEQVVKEENGTIVRYLPSVTGSDKWHFESGYVGAIKKAESFLWDKETGLLDIICTSV